MGGLEGVRQRRRDRPPTIMKTAISLPDDVFHSTEILARRLHISRSRLYVEALKSYLEKNNQQAVTERLNKVYGEKETSALDSSLKVLQGLTLRGERWQR